MGTPKHQLCGAGWDIVHEAIDAYDSWMADDDYDANRVLRAIIERMRFRRSLYMPHETDEP